MHGDGAFCKHAGVLEEAQKAAEKAGPLPQGHPSRHLDEVYPVPQPQQCLSVPELDLDWEELPGDGDVMDLPHISTSELYGRLVEEVLVQGAEEAEVAAEEAPAVLLAFEDVDGLSEEAAAVL